MANEKEVISVLSILYDSVAIENVWRSIKYHAASRSAYLKQISEWIKNATLCSACELIHRGFAKRSDFIHKLPKWIASSDAGLACRMIRCGLARPSDFASRLKGWLQNPQYVTCRPFVGMYCDKESLPKALIRKWIKHATFGSARWLIHDGLGTPKDFRNLVDNLIDINPRLHISTIREVSILTDDELGRISDSRAAARALCRNKANGEEVKIPNMLKKNLIETVDYVTLRRLIDSGLVDECDCTRRIMRSIEISSPDSASCLVSLRLARASDFSKKILEWKDRLLPDEAIRLLENCVISQYDVDNLKDSWKECVSPHTLVDMLRLGILSDTEALSYLKLWGGGAFVSKVWINYLFDRFIPPGFKIQGDIIGIKDFGIFVEILPGMVGVVRNSDGRLKTKFSTLRTAYKLGDKITVEIGAIDITDRKIELIA